MRTVVGFMTGLNVLKNQLLVFDEILLLQVMACDVELSHHGLHFNLYTHLWPTTL